MQPLRDRQSGRFLTSLLAFALAVFTLVGPVPVAAGNPHGCCRHMARAVSGDDGAVLPAGADPADPGAAAAGVVGACP